MNTASWMKNIPDWKNLKEINIPGTHDSSTKFCSFSLISSCQSKTYRQQLCMGVRAFDVRVDGENLVHSFCKCKKSRFGRVLHLSDVIDDVTSFLKENPSETVLLIFKDDFKTSGAECFRLLYENYISKNRDIWYTENRFPILGEVRGKIVLIRRTDSFDENIGLNFRCMPYQGGMSEFDSEDFSPNGLDFVTVQDCYNVPFWKKWSNAVKPMFEKTGIHKNNFVLNFLSCAGFIFIPKINSSYINRKFKRFTLKKGEHYGTLMFDFINEEITEKIILSN